MNKKGITLVELIVTFSLVLVIIVGIYNSILQVKNQLEEKQIAKNATEYSATVNNKVHYDILKSDPIAIMVTNDEGQTWISSENVTRQNLNQYLIKASGFSLNRSINELKNKCKNYPCAIYFYLYESDDETQIREKAISLMKKNGAEEPIGLVHNGIYEEDRGRGDSRDAGPDPDAAHYAWGMSISLENDNDVLIINFPIYIKDNNTNYGFKIVYPLS